LLAQPDRALLLDRPTQSADAERLRLPRRTRRAPASLRRALPADRPSIPVDVHTRRPPSPPHPDRQPPAAASNRRMTTELADACTRRAPDPQPSRADPARASAVGLMESQEMPGPASIRLHDAVHRARGR